MIINSYNTQCPDDYKQSPETGLLQQIIPKEQARILDIGSGTGKQCLALSSFAKEVVGIDIQPFMIEYANKHRKANNITYICDDFMNVDLEEGSFDIIITQNVMFHVKDKRAFLEKVHRLLRRGGQFLFTDLTQHHTIHDDENLAYPVTADYYSKTLNELKFSNILFLWEKHWVWDGVYSEKYYSMFKCSK